MGELDRWRDISGWDIYINSFSRFWEKVLFTRKLHHSFPQGAPKMASLPPRPQEGWETAE